MKYQDGEDIELYIETIKQLAIQIGIIQGVTLPELVLVNCILNGLSNELFKEFKRNKTIQPKLSLEELEKELITIVSSERNNNNHIKEFNYSAKHKNKNFPRRFSEKNFKKENNQRKFPEKREITCFECGKPGHKQYQCPSLKNGHKKEHKFKKNSAYSAVKEFGFVVKSNLNEKSEKDIWILDSGASSHICSNKKLFTELKMIENSDDSISVGNGQNVKTLGKGVVKLIVQDTKGEMVSMSLSDVLYVSEMDGNFISFTKITRTGHTYQFDVKGNMFIDIDKKGKILIPTENKHNIITVEVQGYKEKESESIKERLLVSKETEKSELWHKRLGHMGKTNLKQLVHCVDGIDISHDEDFDCEICALTKMTAKPFTRSETKTTEPLQLVHTDIAGPLRTPTALFNERYAILFIDDYSHEMRVYTMKHKSEALDKFKLYRADVRNMNKEIKCLRSDNGGEYIKNRFNKFCKNNGIRREWTIPHTPQQNRIAERAWRSFFEMTRAMLKENNLEDKWWGRAIKTAAYIKNCSLTNGTDEKKTPYELCYGKKPDLSNMKIFGCQVYAHEPKEKYYKLNNRSKSGIFMGFNENVKRYVIYLPKE